MELDPQVSPEEIMSREVELGCESWTSFVSGCSSTAAGATDIVSVCDSAQHGQSYKDNVRCTAVEEQLEAKEVQLSQPQLHLPAQTSSGLT